MYVFAVFHLNINFYLNIDKHTNRWFKNNNLGASMSNSTGNMDEQEKEIAKLAEEINPSEHSVPDSLAEVTTAAPLEDDELGGNATEDSIRK